LEQFSFNYCPELVAPRSNWTANPTKAYERKSAGKVSPSYTRAYDGTPKCPVTEDWIPVKIDGP